MRRASFWPAACGVVVLAVAGCGGESSGHGKIGLPVKSESKQSATPSSPASMGNYKHVPGQAGKAQQALTAAGFECTRHSDPAIDLRLCSKGVNIKASGQFDEDSVLEARIRFLSDPDGTVVLAKVEGFGDTNDPQWKTLQQQMISSVVPADDAAVVAAGGKDLSWGTYFAEAGKSASGWLQVTGYGASELEPQGKPLEVTKEKALPKLTGESLKCSFGNPITGDDQDTLLTCTDPSFKSSHGDGSMEGPTATLQVTDEDHAGITGITLKGEHAGVPDDIRAVKGLLPKLSALGDSVSGIQQWTTSHLDGAPHSAYVGDHLVNIDVVPDSMTGDVFAMEADLEENGLGFDMTKVDTGS